jgi:hypothetical protein
MAKGQAVESRCVVVKFKLCLRDVPVVAGPLTMLKNQPFSHQSYSCGFWIGRNQFPEESKVVGPVEACVTYHLAGYHVRCSVYRILPGFKLDSWKKLAGTSLW